MTSIEQKIKNICEIDLVKKIPRHSMIIPEKEKIECLPKYYCHDSRKNDCKDHVSIGEKSYCMYHTE